MDIANPPVDNVTISSSPTSFISVSTQRVVSNSDQVGYLNFMQMELADKGQTQAQHSPPTQDNKEQQRVKNSLDYIADIFAEELTSSDDEESEESEKRHPPHLEVTTTTTHETTVDYSVPMNVELGEQLSPNAFAKGIENMETRDSIPMPRNRVNTVRNALGWLWLGGIQGQGTDIRVAINGAMQELEGEYWRVLS